MGTFLRDFRTSVVEYDPYGYKLQKTAREAVKRGECSAEWGPFHDMHAFRFSGIRAEKTP